MEATRAMFLLLIFAVLVSSSQSGSIIPRPRPLSSLRKINTTTTSTQNAGTCSYTVVIRTSCSSISYTRDRISLAFGDAYGNQVYVPRLDDPRSRTFERCSTDTFDIYGPCTYQICYVYLYRQGYDGWIPYDVTIYGYNTNPVSFYYNVRMPRDIWYGFDHCYYGARSGSAAVK
ncbi:embryo-specific protein ATS3B-like isoform X2 [Andrographis paniculata]|uniref:embryo-specific protein ATS3B-like isoform X2 n=1 Tax=Andrographis paniculata TaxID=175694 RepID=UPI0021E8D00B|nr:embryo-specific protein ATS3B-like isoform X2 [Andrographis paniculata]